MLIHLCIACDTTIQLLFVVWTVVMGARCAGLRYRVIEQDMVLITVLSDKGSVRYITARVCLSSARCFGDCMLDQSQIVDDEYIHPGSVCLPQLTPMHAAACMRTGMACHHGCVHVCPCPHDVSLACSPVPNLPEIYQ